jgi:3-hydroxyisobutyrate dehydrogenase-like beta-hydroxyacid dehydrogenase
MHEREPKQPAHGAVTQHVHRVERARASDHPRDLHPRVRPAAPSAVLDLKRDKLLNHEYSLGGSARNQIKYLRYALGTARRHDARVPLLTVLADLFEQVEALGRGEEDHSVVLELFRD